jgi:hypothetical protein
MFNQMFGREAGLSSTSDLPLVLRHSQGEIGFFTSRMLPKNNVVRVTGPVVAGYF